MRAMLGHDHTDRRQLGNLVTTEPPTTRALLRDEPGSAVATPIGVVIDDLIKLILRPQLATRALVPALPASLAALAL